MNKLRGFWHKLVHEKKTSCTEYLCHDASKDPYPYRILEDIGSSYLMGFGGGCVRYFMTGILTGPVGGKIKLGRQLAAANSPKLGMSFATYSAGYALSDSIVSMLRKRTDISNAVISGMLSGSIMNFPNVRLSPYESLKNCSVLIGVEALTTALSRRENATPAVLFRKHQRQVEKDKKRNAPSPI